MPSLTYGDNTCALRLNIVCSHANSHSSFSTSIQAFIIAAHQTGSSRRHSTPRPSVSHATRHDVATPSNSGQLTRIARGHDSNFTQYKTPPRHHVSLTLVRRLHTPIMGQALIVPHGAMSGMPSAWFAWLHPNPRPSPSFKVSCVRG